MCVRPRSIVACHLAERPLRSHMRRVSAPHRFPRAPRCLGPHIVNSRLAPSSATAAYGFTRRRCRLPSALRAEGVGCLRAEGVDELVDDAGVGEGRDVAELGLVDLLARRGDLAQDAAVQGEAQTREWQGGLVC